MRKRLLNILFFAFVLLCGTGIVMINSGNTTAGNIKNIEINENYLVKDKALHLVLPQSEVEETIFHPFLGKSLNGFKEAMGYKESRGNYFVVNSYGYLGKYQFGPSTLRGMGIYNTTFFLKHPEIQERAFIAYLGRNKWILRQEIEKYNGKVLYGVKVTESGILAAAHLAGAGNVKRYLRSSGNRNFKDANGTSIRHYMRKFSGYDLSPIVPDRKAKI